MCEFNKKNRNCVEAASGIQVGNNRHPLWDILGYSHQWNIHWFLTSNRSDGEPLTPLSLVPFTHIHIGYWWWVTVHQLYVSHHYSFHNEAHVHWLPYDEDDGEPVTSITQLFVPHYSIYALVTDCGNGSNSWKICLVSIDHLPRHIAPDGSLNAVLGRLTGKETIGGWWMSWLVSMCTKKCSPFQVHHFN